MNLRLILASTSPIRRQLLQRAAVPFETRPPDLDEKRAKQNHRHLPIESLALNLARDKALSVKDSKNTLILGADQTLICDHDLFEKPATLQEARQHLQRLRGKTHVLHTALAIAENDAIVWTDTSQARLTMRALTDEAIAAYLQRQGEDILSSVGAYKLEEEGITLFEKIEGDYFSILGLPLLPLLQFLRLRGIMPS